jgi:hypothetical protein
MKAFEVMGKFDEKGQLLLDKPLEIYKSSQVRVIILVSDDIESDPDDTSVVEIKESLTRAFEEVKSGKTRPISELWERIENE